MGPNRPKSYSPRSLSNVNGCPFGPPSAPPERPWSVLVVVFARCKRLYRYNLLPYFFSWVRFGSSWGFMGPPGAILGPSNNKIEVHIENCQTPFALGVETTPKTTPKRLPNECKIKTKNASVFVIPLGSVLNRS